MRAKALAVCTLALICVRAYADSAPAWLQLTTPHFTVITDAGDKQAHRIAVQFERMQAVFSRLLPSARSDPGVPVVVLALKNKRDFQAIEPADYLAKGQLDLSGLFIQSDERCYILVRLDASGDYPYATMYHEYTHYITRHAHLPLWLNEGIAEFYQNTNIESHQVYFGQPSAADIHLLRSQNLLPLATLFTVDRNSPYYHEEQKGSIFYSESWALTYLLFLNDFRNHTHLLSDYVKALSSGQNSLTAAVSAFGDLRKLQRDLEVQISHDDVSFLTAPVDISVDESAFNVTSVSAADGDAYRAAFLLAVGRTSDARNLLHSVLAANPRNALAHESEGILHIRDHDYAAARQSYAAAVANHSTSFFAWYYAATLALRSGEHDDPDIGRELEESLKLNPDFAPANDALASYYAVNHRLDEAIRLSNLAISQDPDNFGYRFNNAGFHMQGKEFASALSTLEAARPLARTPAEVAELNSRVDQIHRRVDDEKAALTPVADAMPSPDRHPKGVTLLDNNPDPHYPETPPGSSRHTVKGVLHNVHCTYPTILTLTVDGGAKPLALYTNHVYDIDYWVTFYPQGGLDPCKIDGMKATVTYADVKDPRVAGQIVSIMVSK